MCVSAALKWKKWPQQRIEEEKMEMRDPKQNPDNSIRSEYDFSLLHCTFLSILLNIGIFVFLISRI